MPRYHGELLRRRAMLVQEVEVLEKALLLIAQHDDVSAAHGARALAVKLSQAREEKESLDEQIRKLACL